MVEGQHVGGGQAAARSLVDVPSPTLQSFKAEPRQPYTEGVHIARADLLLASLALLLCGSRPIISQSAAASPGTLTEMVVAASAPSQTYALYLPSRYSSAHQWP